MKETNVKKKNTHIKTDKLPSDKNAIINYNIHKFGKLNGMPKFDPSREGKAKKRVTKTVKQIIFPEIRHTQCLSSDRIHKKEKNRKEIDQWRIYMYEATS